MDIRVGDAAGLSNISFAPRPAAEKARSGAFQEALDAAAMLVSEANDYQLKADKAQRDLASGETDDILSVLLAQEKAYSSLNFTVQLANKAIESYREIMRMQI
jgi:flagellar hook-basal body complex protein FliE